LNPSSRSTIWREEKVDVESTDDDEQLQEVVEVEPQPLDGYPGGPCVLFVLTVYHVHVGRIMSDGLLRFYNFNLFV
jgi:hypothetical protein